MCFLMGFDFVGDFSKNFQQCNRMGKLFRFFNLSYAGKNISVMMECVTDPGKIEGPLQKG